MKRAFPLIFLILLVTGCIGLYNKPKVSVISPMPLPSHNGNVETFYSPDKFPEQSSYIKVAVIQQVASDASVSKQTAALKSIAQQYGADGLLILGINESGVRTATKSGLGNDVLAALKRPSEVDFYSNVNRNEIFALAIKSKRKLNSVSKSVKSMKLYKYSPKQDKFDLLDTYQFSLNRQIVSGNEMSKDFLFVKSYSSFFLTYDKSSDWKESVREKNLIVREYNGYLGPKLVSSTVLNNNGDIDQITKIYPHSQKKETIKYAYLDGKLVGRTITTKDQSVYEEKVKQGKQNAIEEVTVFEHGRKSISPLYKIELTYYTTADLESSVAAKSK